MLKKLSNKEKQSSRLLMIEAGVAYGLGKHCILIGEQETAESLYLIFDEHYDTPEDFLATILL